MQHFCPYCFAEVPRLESRCPACGRAMAEADPEGFTERLVHALAHPLGEVRMAAAITLGNRAEPSTAAPLARCALAYPLDVPQALEVVRSLGTFPPSNELREALGLLTGHPARVVAARAKDLLRRLERE